MAARQGFARDAHLAVGLSPGRVDQGMVVVQHVRTGYVRAELHVAVEAEIVLLRDALVDLGD